MQVYLVGGAVRDQLLGKPVKDKDYVVVGATPKQMLTKNFLQVGADFPVFLHPQTKQEYALARTERKTGKTHTDFQIFTSPEVTLEEDLLRRDLTINAMAIQVQGLNDDEPVDGRIIDPYGGLADIKNKQLRHVSPAFLEDPLRILRVARFYGRYYQEDGGFTVAKTTLELIELMLNNDALAHLTAERVWQESKRALMQTAPQAYWQFLYEHNALTSYFEPLKIIWAYKPIYAITQTALRLAGQLQLNLAQRWALLLCGFIPKLIASHLKKQTEGLQQVIQQVQQLGKEVKVPSHLNKFVTLLFTYFQELSNVEQLSATQKLTLLQACQAHKDPDQLNELLLTANVINLAKKQYIMQTALNSFHAIGMPDIADNLTGAQIGEALFAARVRHLEGQNTSI